MAISQVRANINGTWYTLAYDSASKTYKATVTAQGATSYNQTGGYYNVAVEATNTAGTTGTASATAKSTTFTVDTVPPTLNITSPADGLITNTAALVVAGSTNDATSSPVTVTIALNGADQGAVTVSSGGTFSKTVTLADGDNTIVITATDSVTLDTSVPTITAASITPNPADTGATVIISVTVAEG